jgi:hypothetical protein
MAGQGSGGNVIAALASLFIPGDETRSPVMPNF